MALATAQTIADRACNELGLPTGSVEPSLANQLGTQILALMNSLGEDLIRVHDWQELQATATLTGDGVATSFAMPADFGRVVNQTFWASSDRLPGIGPVSAETWGWLNYGIVGVSTAFYRYRVLNDRLHVFPTPGVGEEFKFYYIKKNWVLDADTVTYKDTVAAADDTILFDKNVMIKGMKLRLWEQKGFDTTHLSNEFNYYLDAIRGQSQGAAAINLSGHDVGIFIDPYRNIKEGNW